MRRAPPILRLNASKARNNEKHRPRRDAPRVFARFVERLEKVITRSERSGKAANRDPDDHPSNAVRGADRSTAKNGEQHG